MNQYRFNLLKQVFCRLINKLEKRLLEMFIYLYIFIFGKTKSEVKPRGEEKVVCGSQVN